MTSHPMVRARATFFCAQAMVLAACTEYLAIDPSVARVDAGALADAAAPPTDAGAADAGPDLDGAADTSANRCADGTAHDFCENFETSGDYAAHFGGGPELVGEGTLRLVDEKQSANTALEAAIAFRDGGAPQAARISEQAVALPRPDGTVPPIVLSMRMRVERGDVSDRPVAFAYVMTANSPRSEDGILLMLVSDGANGFTVQCDELASDADGGNPAYTKTATPLHVETGVWTDVAVRVNERNATAAGSGIVITVAGSSHSQPVTTTNLPSRVRVDVGAAAFYGGGSSWRILFDDVMLDYR